MNDTWPVVGLGDPGTWYARNRHNIGYMVLDVLTECIGSRFSQHKKARVCAAEGRLGMISGETPDPRIILAESSVFMNLSSGPVAGLVSYHGIDLASRLLVIHDELDLPAHELRLKRGGGEGGHNGLCSISKSVSTKDYACLRVGIGRPPGCQDPFDFALSDSPGHEHADLGVILEQVADAVEQVVTTGFDDAQQCLHAPR